MLPGNARSKGTGSDMLAGSGVRGAAGGMELHRGRELLREIPCTFTAGSYVLGSTSKIV